MTSKRDPKVTERLELNDKGTAPRGKEPECPGCGSTKVQKAGRVMLRSEEGGLR